MAGEETLSPYERLIKGTATPIPGLNDSNQTLGPDIELTLGKLRTYVDNSFKNNLDKVNNAFRILTTKTIDTSIKTTNLVEHLAVIVKKTGDVSKKLFSLYTRTTKRLKQQRESIKDNAEKAETEIVDKIEKAEEKNKSVFDVAISKMELACITISFTVKSIKSFGKWFSGDGKVVNSIIHFLADKGKVYKSLSGLLSSLGDKVSDFMDNTFGRVMWFFGSFGGVLFSGLKFLGTIGWKIFEWVAKVGFFAIDFMWKTFKGLAQIGWNVVAGVFTTILDIGKKAGSFLLDIFLDIISNPILVGVGIFALKYWFNKDKENIFDKFMNDVISPAFQLFMEPIKKAFDFTGKTFSSVMGWGNEKWDFIKASLQSTFDIIKSSPIINNWFTQEFVNIIGVSYSSIRDVIVEFLPKITDFISYIKNDIIKLLPIDKIKSFVSDAFSFIQIFYNIFKYGTGYGVERERQRTMKSAQSLLNDKEIDFFNRNLQIEILDIVEAKYNNTITKDNKDNIRIDLNRFTDSYIQAKKDKIKDDNVIGEIKRDAGDFIDAILDIRSDKLKTMKLDIQVDQAAINHEITNIKKIMDDLKADNITEDMVRISKINIKKLLVTSDKNRDEILKDHKSESNRLSNLIFGYVQMDLKNFDIDYLQNISDLNKTLFNTALTVGSNMADINYLRQTFTSNMIGYYSSFDNKKRQEYLKNIITEIENKGGKVPSTLLTMYNQSIIKTMVNNSTPGMADGGVVFGATLAVIGEGPDPEVVIPINKDGISFVYNSMIEKFDEYESEIEQETPNVINTMGGISIQQADDTLFDLSNISKGLLVLG
jgi:hypothetical protein